MITGTILVTKAMPFHGQTFLFMHFPICLLMLSATVRDGFTSCTSHRPFRLPAYFASHEFHRSPTCRGALGRILFRMLSNSAPGLLAGFDFAFAVIAYSVHEYRDGWILFGVKVRYRCLHEFCRGRAAHSASRIRDRPTGRLTLFPGSVY